MVHFATGRYGNRLVDFEVNLRQPASAAERGVHLRAVFKE